MEKLRCLKLSILTAIILCTNSSASQILDEFQTRATAALASEDKISTYDSVVEVFKPVMHPETCELFETYFTILFNKDFPKAPHPQSKMLEFFRCLYASLAESQLIEARDKSLKQQKAELDKRLFFHKAAIAHFNKDLADKIAGFPCENCAKSEKKQIMGWKPNDNCLE